MSGFLTVGLISALMTQAGPDLPVQETPAAGIILRVTGDVPRPLELTAAQLGRLPRRSVRARDHDGKEGGFEGVPLVGRS